MAVIVVRQWETKVAWPMLVCGLQRSQMSVVMFGSGSWGLDGLDWLNRGRNRDSCGGWGNLGARATERSRTRRQKRAKWWARRMLTVGAVVDVDVAGGRAMCTWLSSDRVLERSWLQHWQRDRDGRPREVAAQVGAALVGIGRWSNFGHWRSPATWRSEPYFPSLIWGNLGTNRANGWR